MNDVHVSVRHTHTHMNIIHSEWVVTRDHNVNVAIFLKYKVSRFLPSPSLKSYLYSFRNSPAGASLIIFYFSVFSHREISFRREHTCLVAVDVHGQKKSVQNADIVLCYTCYTSYSK